MVVGLFTEDFFFLFIHYSHATYGDHGDNMYSPFPVRCPRSGGSSFNNVDKTILGQRMEVLGLEADLIRWTMSFMSDRRVKLVLDGETGEDYPVDTGVPQGSPAAPILFVTYLSGIFDVVEQAAPGISGLSFVDDIGWLAEGKGEEEVAAKLSEAAAAAM